MATRVDDFDFGNKSRKVRVTESHEEVKATIQDSDKLDWEAIVITLLCKNVDDDRITAKDLKDNEIPSRRESKRHSDRVQWRGMNSSSNLIKLMYQPVNKWNMAKVFNGDERGHFTDSPINTKPSTGMRAV